MLALTQGGTVHEVDNGGAEQRSLRRRLTVEEEDICGEVCDDLQRAFDDANAQLMYVPDDQDMDMEQGVQESNATLYDVPFLSESDLESETETGNYEPATDGNRLRGANPDPGATPSGGR